MDAAMLQSSGDTLLIVDDEPLITELFDQFMTKRGFHVVTASSAAEALEIVDSPDVAIDLVITDMTMPQMDGLTLARELSHRAPALPVMLATGHAASMETAEGLTNVVAVVRKPYQNRVLAELIRETLGARSPEHS